MDSIIADSEVRAPQGPGLLARINFNIYRIERGLVWVALLTMSLGYFLQIVEGDLTAGPGQNTIDRFILEWRGETSESIGAEELTRIHTVVGPRILWAVFGGLLLIASLTAQFARGRAVPMPARLRAIARMQRISIGVLLMFAVLVFGALKQVDVPGLWWGLAVVAAIIKWLGMPWRYGSATSMRGVVTSMLVVILIGAYSAGAYLSASWWMGAAFFGFIGWTLSLPKEGRSKWADRALFVMWSILAVGLFIIALKEGMASTHVCTLIVLGCFAWSTVRSLRKGSLLAFVLWIPWVLAMLWFCSTILQSGYTWAKELSMVLLMWVGFVGASMATYEGRNIRVDFVRKNVPVAWRCHYEIISGVVTSLFTCILAYLAYTTVTNQIHMAGQMASLPLPDWLVPLPIAISFGIMALRYFDRSYRLAKGHIQPDVLGAPTDSGRFITVCCVLVGLMALAVIGMEQAGLRLVVPILVLLMLGAPLYVVIGASTLACFAIWPEVPQFMSSSDAFVENFNLMDRMIQLSNEEALIAIPFFMVAGAIMSRGAIARHLVECARAAIGWLPGGLAISAVGACVLFAAISGSSPVTVITIGAIMYPALVKAGYSERFSLGLVTSAGSLGIIIPPSIPMIVYAIFATLFGKEYGMDVDIKDIFVAGILPGILIAVALCSVCVYKGLRIARERFDGRRLLRALQEGFWALLLPVFILAGIYSGLFNAIEASAIAVIFALVIELFIHRALSVDDLPALFSDSAALMGSILVIISVALGLSEFLAIKQIPNEIIGWLSAYELTALEFVLMLNVLLLIVGCLMDIISALILFVPLIIPLAAQLGIHPIHLGLIFIVNLEIGYLTPPLGLNLFVASGFFQKPFGQVMRSVLPFIGVLLLSLVLITAIPSISVGLVNKMHGKPFYTPFPTGKTLQPIEQDEDAALTSDFCRILLGEGGENETGSAGVQTMTNLSRNSEVGIKVKEGAKAGALDDFELDSVRAVAINTDGKHVRTAVILTSESENCEVLDTDPQDDEWLLRIELPAGLASKQQFVLPGKVAQAEVRRYEAGVLTETRRPISGSICIVDPERGDAISTWHPEKGFMTEGLFGAFELDFGDEVLRGKFVPEPCDEGTAPFYY